MSNFFQTFNIPVSAMVAPPVEAEGKTVFETIKKRPLDKKKRDKNDNPEDITGFLGPWGGFVGEQRYIITYWILCKYHKYHILHKKSITIYLT